MHDDDTTASLFEAIHKGNAARVQELVDTEPALAQARDAAGVKALLVAKYVRQTAVEAVLTSALAGAVLDIFEAVALGRIELLRTFLDAEAAALSATSPDGFTPLHYAAFFQRSECAQLLIERGADVNAAAANAMQTSPLHGAAAAHDLALVELLLERGADPNAVQLMGYTALHAAAQHGDVAMVRALLNHGANPKLVTEEGKTPLDFARSAGDPATEALLS